MFWLVCNVFNCRVLLIDMEGWGLMQRVIMLILLSVCTMLDHLKRIRSCCALLLRLSSSRQTAILEFEDGEIMAFVLDLMNS